MTGEKRGAVHDYILQFKELSTRLGPELSSKWALSARHTGLLLQGAEASKHVTGPIFAVYAVYQILLGVIIFIALC